MKKLLILLALTLSVHQALASLPFYDAFTDATANGGTTYAVGSPLAGQQNNPTNVWNEVNQNGGGAQPLITSGNLSYPGLPLPLGNCVSFAPSAVGVSNQSVRLNFFQTNQSGPSYYSFILKVTDLSQVPATSANNFFCGFSDGNIAQPGAGVARIGSRILTKASGGGFVLGIGRNNTTSDYVYDTTVHNVGDTLFIVASYELVLSNTTVIKTNVNLWINPATNSFGSATVPSPTVSAVNTSSTAGDINTNRVAGFCILCQNSNAPSGLIDQVRVSTTWSDATGGDPSILLPPSSTSVPPGNTVHFTVTAAGTPTLTYQWYQNGTQLFDGGNISGSTSANLTLTSVVGTNDGTYYVIVQNGNGNTAQSSSATLLVITDPIVNTPPQNTTNNFGTTATFTVVAGGTSPFTYQWHEVGVGNLSDGGNVSGSHTATLSLSGVGYTNDGSYYVTVTNANHQSVDSQPATLTVNDPYFSLQPTSLTLLAGSNAVFQAVAVGSGSNSFTYQWYKGNSLLFNNGNISGADTTTLTVANISLADQSNYYATVVGNTTATSAVVQLTVEAPVSITAPPNPRTVVPGVNVAFVVASAGSTPYQYQWLRNGGNVSGATASTLALTNVGSGVAGNYQVIISNSFSSVTSSIAPLVLSNTLTLSSNNLIVIRVGDGSQNLTLNGNSVFLDQFDTNGNYLNTVTIPDSGTNALIAIGLDNVTGVNSGSTTGSCLSQSLDGRYLAIAGYNTNVGFGSKLAASTAAAVPRAVGLIQSQGGYAMPVAATNSALNSTTSRSAITDGTNNFWGGSDTGGTYYFGLNGAAGLIQTNMSNMRSMALFNGNIYGASALATQTGILEVGGLPQAFNSTNGVFLFAGSSGTFDMAVSPNGNTIYVADQRAVASGGGVQRWDFNGTTWSLTYTLQIAGSGSGGQGPRYVAADFRGSSPVIYVTSNDSSFDNNRVIKVIDTGANSTGTALTFAGANETFRGIRFGPTPDTVVARPTLLFSRISGNIVLSWSGSFHLQSATNVVGTYTNVPSGTSSPFTNSFSGASKMFFRLSQ